MPDLCIHCQRPAEDHHDFESVVMPKGCQCDPGTWAPMTPTAICKEYDGEGQKYCRGCAHDQGCHRA